ncbi:hypothetical protein COO60DRAFT_1519405, partial [Scenedesmus sp. NREL 46B-D3]
LLGCLSCSHSSEALGGSALGGVCQWCACRSIWRRWLALCCTSCTSSPLIRPAACVALRKCSCSSSTSMATWRDISSEHSRGCAGRSSRCAYCSAAATSSWLSRSTNCAACSSPSAAASFCRSPAPACCALPLPAPGAAATSAADCGVCAAAADAAGSHVPWGDDSHAAALSGAAGPAGHSEAGAAALGAPAACGARSWPRWLVMSCCAAVWAATKASMSINLLAACCCCIGTPSASAPQTLPSASRQLASPGVPAAAASLSAPQQHQTSQPARGLRRPLLLLRRSAAAAAAAAGDGGGSGGGG